MKISYNNVFYYYVWSETVHVYTYNTSWVNYGEMKNIKYERTLIMYVLNFYDVSELKNKQKEFMRPGGLSESVVEEAVKRQYHPKNFGHWKDELNLE